MNGNKSYTDLFIEWTNQRSEIENLKQQLQERDAEVAALNLSCDAWAENFCKMERDLINGKEQLKQQLQVAVEIILPLTSIAIKYDNAFYNDNLELIDKAEKFLEQIKTIKETT